MTDWDARYRSLPSIWSREPNPQLVAEVSGLPAGRALDVGCGEGADALWLAARGWQVTAVDFSQVALDRARGRAVEVGADVDWRRVDVTGWQPVESFDLVSVQFLHLPERNEVYRDLAAAVAQGGRLLVVGHDPRDADAGIRRPPRELLFTADDVVGMLDVQEWVVEVAQARPRAGDDATVHDVVVLARRR